MSLVFFVHDLYVGTGNVALHSHMTIFDLMDCG